MSIEKLIKELDDFCEMLESDTERKKIWLEEVINCGEFLIGGEK